MTTRDDYAPDQLMRLEIEATAILGNVAPEGDTPSSIDTNGHSE